MIVSIIASPLTKASRSSRRELSLGAQIVQVDHVLVPSGIDWDFFKGEPPASYVISDLTEELYVTRKLLKEYIRKSGIRIVAAHEHHRDVSSTAQKVGEHRDDVQAILRPLFQELLDEMLNKKEKGKD